jgi:hypothetical protein
MRGFSVLLAALAGICAIVVAPLDQGDAQLFPVVGVETQRVAPFEKVGLVENVLVVGAPPNPALRLVSLSVDPVIDDPGSLWHFDRGTMLYSVRPKKKRLSGLLIPVNGRYWPAWTAPVDLNPHVSCRRVATILPTRKDSKAVHVKMFAMPVALGKIVTGSVQILGSSNLGSESVDEYIGALDCGQRFFGMPQRGLHIAGLSDASAPSDNQDSKSREGDEHCGPCQPFRIFGHTFVGASAPAARGAFWGAIWGLGALIVIFWIDYLDRRSYRKNRDGQQRTQYDFGNAKPPQNKTPSLTKFPPV